MKIAKEKVSKIVLIILITLNFDFIGNSCADSPKAVTIDYQGKPQKVTYDLYVPLMKDQKRLPILVCVGGLPMEGKKYLRSDTGECLDEPWKRFADKNHMAILGLGFLFMPEDWPAKASYQYPHIWSGEALLNILKTISKEFPVDPDQLYLFGISAGAQFSIRFAQMKPDISKAVAAHAAGGYDSPEHYIPTKFFITVGRQDNKEITRREMAKVFARACRLKRIDLTLKIIPGIAHRQTEEQNEMSRKFFERILWAQRNPHAHFSGWSFY